MFAQQTRYCLNHLPSPQLDHSLLGTLSYVCVCVEGGCLVAGVHGLYLLFSSSSYHSSMPPGKKIAPDSTSALL